MEAEAARPQALRSSPYLRGLMSEHEAISDIDVFRGVAAGDRVCVRIVTEAADRLAVENICDSLKGRVQYFVTYLRRITCRLCEFSRV